ncbi:MAG: hypothetical protein RI996_413 [Candidatus Parcubacteria bacterium]|jgi:oligoribonuclease NrnB/cAMP/cGMP phosphodiesterase (DHH superfamily)
MSKNIVIYHKNCPDGSTAAALFYKKFGESAVYIACSHGDGLPDEVSLCENKKEINLYIVDFSFSLEIMQNLKEDFLSLTVLDHHISASEAVLSVGGIFDNTKSGASLAYTFLFGESVPEFVKIIEQIDLHKNGNTDLQDIAAYINSCDHSIETYTQLLNTFEEKYSVYLQEGKAINRYVTLLEEMLTGSFDIVEWEGVRMPAVNMVFDINTKSRILAKLYELMPPVSMSYRLKGSEWGVSLRSNGDFDTTTITTKYNGGGHAGASGCVVPATGGELFFKVVGKYKDGVITYFDSCEIV